MTVVTTILAFVGVLVPLIVIHEAGHFLAARWVGVRVEQFSVGFPPRIWGRKWGETEYLISWIPLGGYVRLFGQNLEDEDPNDPSNYAAKSIWQRMLILVAGPAANLLTALVVMPIVYLMGVSTPGYFADAPLIDGVEPASAAERLGIQAGDLIVRVGTEPIQTWDDFYQARDSMAVAGNDPVYTLERNGQEVVVTVPLAELASGEPFGWREIRQPVAGNIIPGSPAEQAGIQSGDRIQTIGGVAITRWAGISREVKQSGGGALAITVEREGQTLSMEIFPKFDEERQQYLLGIYPVYIEKTYGFFESIAMGTKRLGEITVGTFAFLANLVTGGGSMDQVGGPVKIATFIEKAASTSFASLALMVALISLQLGLLNLLPIPALDGGHIVYFLLPELLKGGPVSPKLRARIQTVGITVLMLLMVAVTYNDIVGML